ncbi:MAG: hypothetical protein E7294_07155 [Lachnospiraceae bacterium]|jgi:hypothetical protein|nr:hypothetical protein [Lachnospiraceae bacterium]
MMQRVHLKQTCISFYITRYEKELKSEKDYEKAIKDFEYFRDEMLKSEYRNDLDHPEADNLIHCVNNIVTRITAGSKIGKEVKKKDTDHCRFA